MASRVGIRRWRTLIYRSMCAAKTAYLTRFKIEPQAVTLRDTEPGRAVTREVMIAGTDGQTFRIVSATSEKGLVELLDQTRVGGQYRLRLKITPPPSEHRLGVYSDVLYVSVLPDGNSDKDAQEPIKLPINCRGAYRRPRR
ncbi:MAG: hypothetical protein JSU94_06250 [Phycisphaerales bacterium]|nr:MAG: hypothetical protein JSU94_06250 [Phycisphaerales bacterium]